MHQRSALYWALNDSLTMIRRSLRHTLRNVDSLLLSAILPIMLLLLFVHVFGGAIDTSGQYVNYVVPGIILLCAGYGSANTAIGVANDMVTGIIDRFRSLPILSSAVLTGHVVASLARNAFATLLVIAAAYLNGFRPAASLLDWLAVGGVLLLFILAMSWLAVALGLTAKTVEGASGFTFVILFLPYLSSAFVPTATMPAALRVIADHQPITPVIETLRALMLGTPVGMNGWLTMAWFTGILAVSCTLATYQFKQRNAG
ncbi:MAG TPA: ABC transporter permease [Micromonosporaceae bacterium]|nr:ABC transporter permease [Micromonosporaceae bacterium]